MRSVATIETQYERREVRAGMEPGPIEETLRRSEERLRVLIRHTSDVVSIVDPDGTIRWQSPSTERVLGYSPEALAGTSVYDLVHPEDAPTLRATFGHLAATPARPETIDLRARHRDGSWRDLEASATSMVDTPSVGGIVITARDVTERKAFEGQLARQAFYDSLTGLPNRILFTFSIERALAGARRNNVGVAVMYLDLDGFKSVNDTLGHHAGDRLLALLAERLRSSVRPGDTVARLGGDEFTVLLEDIIHPEQAELVARRIVERLDQPFDIDGRAVSVTASIGIAFGTDADARPADLLRFADAAMYRAKTEGKARYVVFDRAMHADWVARSDLEAELRGALERGELRLHYQPIVDLATGRIVGAEALVRWLHPERGLLLPQGFLRVAEETGLIVPLGAWVLAEACRQARAWQRERSAAESFWVSVNFSPRQLRQPDLVAQVGRALRETELDPAALRLELGEGAIVEDGTARLATVEALQAVGVRVAIDDFGTGSSSLTGLRRLPARTLKLDQSVFAGPDARDARVVRAVVDLAHALDMDVVAEGIETADQLALLRATACDHGQGFLFSKPVDAEALGALLGSGASLR